jgi:hypothetical protein
MKRRLLLDLNASTPGSIDIFLPQKNLRPSACPLLYFYGEVTDALSGHGSPRNREEEVADHQPRSCA